MENKNANFTPSLEGYTGQQTFRFWCQTVLPLVYDDSLSYYELLNKVVAYLNNTISDVSAVESNTEALLNSFNLLQNYVNNYFDDLNYTEIINAKLDEMASDGTLTKLISAYTQPLIDEQNNKIAVLEGRVNVLTSLPDGSTSGDAELQDIRVGANGTTYPTAGDAVRAQFNNTEKQVDALNVKLDEIGSVNLELTLTSGYYASTGVNIVAPTVNAEVYTQFIPINGALQLELKAISGKPNWFRICYYAGDRSFITQVAKSNAAGEAYIYVLEPPATAKFCTISFRTYGESDVAKLRKYFSTEELSDNVTNIENTLGYISPKFETVKFISRQGQIDGNSENSIEGIKASKKYGYDIIRLSVNVTSDVVPILAHNNSITIKGTAYTINATPYDTLKDNVITVEQAVVLCRNIGLELVLELKGWVQAAHIPTIWNVVAKHAMTKNVTWSAYSVDRLNAVKALQGDAKLGLIGHLDKALIDAAITLKNGKNDVRVDCYNPDANSTWTDDYSDENLTYAATNEIAIKIGSVYNVTQLYNWVGKGLYIECSGIKYPQRIMLTTYLDM